MNEVLGALACRAARPLVPLAAARVSARVLALALTVAAAVSCAASVPQRPALATVDGLARALARQPIVLLGEVHDNAAQHALRLQALRQRIEGGARPALAFEQLDGDRQAALDQARAAFGPADTLTDRVAKVIEQAGGRGWNWDLYRPYLALALEHDLPIVAANLSRAQAMQVAQQGVGVVFDAQQRAALGLEHIAPDIEQAQRREIEEGHCGRLPADALGAIAIAQVARDAMLAQAITPYAERGVVLLTGNGHARRDIGVARHLSERDRSRTLTIGLLEDDEKAASAAALFDVALRTPVQPRADPCRNLPAPHTERPGA